MGAARGDRTLSDEERGKISDHGSSAPLRYSATRRDAVASLAYIYYVCMCVCVCVHRQAHI